VLQRVANVVGDKSTGKTLVAIEACANFARAYPKGRIYYREAESAFDIPYAGRLGLPEDRVDFGPEGIDTHWRTIEDVFIDLRKVCKWHAANDAEGLYIIDSLDALTSKAALARDPGEGSYALEKQKILGQLFEQMIGDFKRGNLCLIIVSQVRDKIGYVIGEKQRRSGGKSLDFYATHIVWLSHIKTLTQTIRGEKRATGIRVLAHCRKNKVSVPFRKCMFPVRFGYGIDDIQASVEFLVEQGLGDRIGIAKRSKAERAGEKLKRKGDGGDARPDSAVVKFIQEMEGLPNAEYAKRAEQIRQVVVKAWADIEHQFEPVRRKYT
jgi:RecA/RadA recombinase